MRLIKKVLNPHNLKIVLKEIFKIGNIKKFWKVFYGEGFNAFWYAKKHLNCKINPLIDSIYEKWLKDNELFDTGKKSKNFVNILIEITDNSYLYILQKNLKSITNYSEIISNIILIENCCNKRKKILERICKKYENVRIIPIEELKNDYEKYLFEEYTIITRENNILELNGINELLGLIDNSFDFIYYDNDCIDFILEHRNTPHFKPDFSPDTLRSFNYIGDCFIINKKHLFQMFSDNMYLNYYDIALKITEKSNMIFHFSKILYHKINIAKDVEESENNKKAIQNQLDRLKLDAKVENGPFKNTFKIDYKLIEHPTVSIVIPNKDEIKTLKTCIDSITKKTTYSNYEILIVENNSENSNTFNYYKEIRSDKVRIIYYPEKEFNYSKIINYGVKNSDSEYIIQLNNDTEVITQNWIEKMLEYAQRNEVGAVGVKLLYYDGTVQHAGTILGLGSIAGHACVNLPKDAQGYYYRNTLVHNVTAVTGACMMCKKETYEKVGYMNEDLAVTFNDVDFCLKIRKEGKLIIYNPFVELLHYESKTRGIEDSPEKIKRFGKEISIFKNNWKEELEKGDPYYNKNLDLRPERQYEIKL